MEREKTPTVESTDSTHRLHEALGEALANGDTADALRLLETLKEALEEKALAGEQSEVAEEIAETEPTPESAESLDANSAVEKIYLLPGVRILIFGTGHGLTVPLSIVMNGQNEGGTYTFAHTKKPSHEAYERGRGSDLTTGLRIFERGDRKAIELVCDNNDAFGRGGFKGLQIVFPVQDNGLADEIRANEAVCKETIQLIWKEMEEFLPNNQKSFFSLDSNIATE